MKSINLPEDMFSLEDFEKGLMLAGLLPPHTVSEVEERECLEQYDIKVREENRLIYFKRAVLAAAIASELSEEPTFGRVKFQKLVYLCEHAAKMNLQGRYVKEAAGPFDKKFMHGIEREFKKQKWFSIVKEPAGNYQRTKYVSLTGCEHHKKYYESYFSDTDSSIRYIINLFRKSRTDIAEIAATLYACALELNEKNEPVGEENLLRLFYDWSPEKEKYSKEQVTGVWRWMIQKGLCDESK